MQKTDGTTCLVAGRIVWVSGNLFTGRPQVIFGTQNPKLNSRGEQMTEYGFGLAVDKAGMAAGADASPGTAMNFWNKMHEQLFTLYPDRNIPPTFALKRKDGDVDVDNTGKLYSERTGYKGHMVFAMTTTLQPKFYRHDTTTNKFVLINEGIKCGDHVVVSVNIVAHGPVGQGKPGFYLNPMAVQLWYTGEEIVNTPSAESMFGTPMPVPPGQSATPTAPTMAPGMAPAPAVAQPNYGVVPPALAPQPAAAPPTMPAPATMPAPPALQQNVQPDFQQPAAQPAAAPVPMPGMPQPNY